MGTRDIFAIPGNSPFTIGGVFVLVVGVLVSVFDGLKKTIFVDASWNYNYLPFQFVYDPIAVLLLLIILAAVVVLFPRCLELSPTQFSTALFGFGVILFGLGLFALPLELTKALDIDKRGLYNGAVFLMNNGPLEFLESFHRLKATAPPLEHKDLYAVESLSVSQEDTTANHFALWFSMLDWIPLNDGVASYVAEYTTQKHGPMSVFMIAPFLFIFGPSTGAALLGNVLITAVVPIISYYTFRIHFSELISRLVAVSLAIGPGLFIWMRHAAPVPYDVFTALFVGISTYTFLQGINSSDRRYYFMTGLTLSLAGLNKLTALVMVLPLVLILLRELADIRTTARRLIETVGAWFVVPTIFLIAGYNFVAQYAYTIYKTTLHKIQYPGGGGYSPSNPAAALEDPIIGLFGTLYNLRWLNIVCCTLAVVLAAIVLRNRTLLRRSKYFISVAFATAFLPFGVWVVFGTGTLSRHTVMLSVPLGFIACAALTALTERSPDVDRLHLVRFGQAALLVSGLQFVINI